MSTNRVFAIIVVVIVLIWGVGGYFFEGGRNKKERCIIVNVLRDFINQGGDLAVPEDADSALREAIETSNARGTKFRSEANRTLARLEC